MTGAVRTFAPRAPAVAGLVAVSAVVGALTAVRPSLTLLAVVVSLGLGVVVIWPDATTPAVVFLLFLNVPAVLVNDHGLPLTLGAAVPLLLIAPLAFHLHRGERLVLDRTFLLLLLYLVVQAVSTSLSTHPEEASQKMTTFALEGLVLYVVVINVVRTPTMLRGTVWAIVAAGSLLAAATLFQNVTRSFARPYGGFSLVEPSFFRGQSTVPRASGPIGDPNYYAQILLVALALGMLACTQERSRRRRLAAGTATALIAIAIALTYSRGAGLALVVLLAMIIFQRYVTRAQLLMIAVGVAVLLIAFPSYRSRVGTVVHLRGATAATGSQSATDVSTRGRLTEMLAAALVFADHPVLGVGPNVFPNYYQQYAEQIGLKVHDTALRGTRQGEQAQRQSHDIFLTVAADVGILGLTVFIAIIANTVWTLVQARRRWLRTRPDLANLATGFLLAVVAYVTAGLFLSLAYERYFWLLIALAGAAGSFALRRAAAEDDASV